MSFDNLQLIAPLLRAVRAEGYTEPSLIQAQAIPHILAGRDVLGCAQTGTGKTAAFALPIIQRLTAQPISGSSQVRALVLSPTRELVAQIGDSFRTYGKFTNIRATTIFGGVNQNPQVERLRRGVDVLVATPGRLLDLMNQGLVKLDRVEILVLDESDRMLDMGFINDVRRIVAVLPTPHQTLLFSATMPDSIKALADRVLKNPVSVTVTPVASTVETIEQRVYFVEHNEKTALLEHLLRDASVRRVLVFTRTKHEANKVAERLRRMSVGAEAIHSNKSQATREKALRNFRAGTTRVLVATDIAARGLDVDGITHVINFNIPNEPDSYVHRIGRTGRAGASGLAYSFCDVEERPWLVDIERLIQMHIPRATEHLYASPAGIPPVTDLTPRSSQHSSRPAPKRHKVGRGLPRQKDNPRSSAKRWGKDQGRSHKGQGQAKSRADLGA